MRKKYKKPKRNQQNKLMQMKYPRRAERITLLVKPNSQRKAFSRPPRSAWAHGADKWALG